jgi:hypothetical protein
MERKAKDNDENGLEELKKKMAYRWACTSQQLRQPYRPRQLARGHLRIRVQKRLACQGFRPSSIRRAR